MVVGTMTTMADKIGETTYYTSGCSVCWVTFTSTNNQAEADQLRASHSCTGSPHGAK